MGVELTFYGGLREIGGTKILLNTDEGSVFLDFGKSFTLENSFFQEPYNPPFYIPSLLARGALPDIKGLYRMEPEKPVDGVIISHAHLDHCGYVPALSPEIPVYAGRDTKELILIRSETNDRGWQNDYSQTPWRTFRTGDVVGVEGTDISFMPIHVDHSVPASYGFIIQAADKKIAYTGDLRMHGRRAEMTQHFLRMLRANRIDALITEGTHVEPEGPDPEVELLAQMAQTYRQKMGEDAPHAITVPCKTEDGLEDHLADIFGAARGMVVVEAAPIDLDRLFSVWRATRRTNRVLVLPARLAYIVQQARRRTLIEDLPPIEGTGLYLSQMRMRADQRGPNDPEDAEEFLRGRRQWQQSLAQNWRSEGGLVVALPQGRDMIREGADTIVFCSPNVASLLPEIAYGADPCAITFVLSRSAPFSPEMAVDTNRLLHWLALFGCREYYHVHVSGHSPMTDLTTVIEAAQPNTLIPIHTRHPEAFARFHDHVESEISLGSPITVR